MRDRVREGASAWSLVGSIAIGPRAWRSVANLPFLGEPLGRPATHARSCAKQTPKIGPGNEPTCGSRFLQPCLLVYWRRCLGRCGHASGMRSSACGRASGTSEEGESAALHSVTSAKSGIRAQRPVTRNDEAQAAEDRILAILQQPSPARSK